MSHALSETDDMVARRRVWRGRALHSLGLFALVWVSYGSYEMVKWAGVPDPWAYLYPVIVDLGVIVVMPYSNDATLYTVMLNHVLDRGDSSMRITHHG